MNRYRTSAGVIILSIMMLSAGCASKIPTDTQAGSQIDMQSDTLDHTQADTRGDTSVENHDSMYQAGTLQSLMLGNYYGDVSVAQIKQRGDIGLGTFDAIDGEMIVLDGEVYQARGDGSVEKCEDDVLSPFCSVTFFDADSTSELKSVTDMQDLKDQLTEQIVKQNKNVMYAVKIEGTFDSVSTRSEHAQQEPYKDLNTVMKTDQVVFEPLNDIEGTIVAVYFPDYMDGINTPGWHFHFLSEDCQSGGHVMDVSFENLKAEMDATDTFEMVLPENDTFKNQSLKTDLDDEIKNVEGSSEK